MLINTSINILGGLPDFNLVKHFLCTEKNSSVVNEAHYTYSAIKTDKAVKRFGRAINATFLKFKNQDIENLLRSMLCEDLITNDSLFILFWHASYNNDLLGYLNDQVFFVSFFSGRIAIKQDDVIACIKELKESEVELKKWSDSTIQTTSSKYLTLLKKFKLMEGSLNKKILHPYLSDKMFIIFTYWLIALETKPNILESKWLKYSFCEQEVFIERLLQKKFSKFFQLTYTGDKLTIETTISYENIYDAIN